MWGRYYVSSLPVWDWVGGPGSPTLPLPGLVPHLLPCSFSQSDGVTGGGRARFTRVRRSLLSEGLLRSRGLKRLDFVIVFVVSEGSNTS